MLADTGTFFVEVPRCKEKYEPEQDHEALTHTCDLAAGHDLPHHCPHCGNYWRKSKR